jgi:hypothetical protein
VNKDALEREQYLNQRLRDCDLEAWYEPLKKFTFPALFLPISQADGRAIMAYYWQHKAGRTMAPENTHLLADLVIRINEAGQGLLEQGEEFPNVFVKLSCRSPKDSDGRQQRAHELAASQLRDWCDEHPGQKPDGNTVGAAVYFGTTNCLRLTSADQVIECFGKSERVCEDDIPLALSFPAKWSQHIVLRPWLAIPTEHEFRAFVFDGKLTGLCQYFSSVHFPGLVEKKAKIESLVIDFFSQIQSQIPISPAEYVMDLAVDVDAQVVHIIEFNPFGAPDGMGTGTVMFNLDVEQDRSVLFGEAPFEFRVTGAPVDGVKGLIKGDWRAFLDKEGFL